MKTLAGHLGPIVLLTLAIVMGNACWQSMHQAPKPFGPLHFLRLEVDPPILVTGQTAELLDGLCNDSDQAYTVQLYLGAQRADSTTFGASPIDLLTRLGATGRESVKDTQEGRLRQVIEPGCTAAEPIVSIVPESLTPGLWQLRAHAIVTSPEGEVQDITITSKPFEVRSQ